MKKIFVVDDDESIRDLLVRFFSKNGYSVMTFESKDSIIGLAEQHKPNAIILDVNLKGEDGREICKDLQNSLHVSIPIILFSGNPQNLINVRECKPDGLINKPFMLKDLLTTVEGLSGS